MNGDPALSCDERPAQTGRSQRSTQADPVNIGKFPEGRKGKEAEYGKRGDSPAQPPTVVSPELK